jgi:hypothetical protein
LTKKKARSEPEFARRLREEFDLDAQPENAEILRQAVEAYDLLQDLKDALEGQPLMLPGRGGPPKANPLIAAIRSQRAALVALIRAINLGGN